LEKYGISAVAAIFLYNKPGQIWWSWPYVQASNMIQIPRLKL
jgi:hypothetical protein